MPILKHILLVDDDDVTNFIHEETLREINAAEKISMAENGKAAFDVLLKDPILPELILLDINMPEMNGIDFLERFKETVPADYRPKIIIMLTTMLTNEDKERIQKLNGLIAGYMDKPVNNKTFLSLLKKYF
ncbi:MAG: response regulator [Bacteroidia bacterium]